MQDDLNAIRKRLKKILDKDRYEHTKGVMYTAGCLAMANGYDVNQAMLAGLLHDCAKCIPDEEKLHLCNKYHIFLTEIEQKNTFLIHAKLGAVLAKEEYGIEDETITHAILVHTTGAPEMNTLDKIIFIADYIEPNRNQAPGLDSIRKTAFQSLDDALKRILSDTLVYLKATDREIDSMTQETYDYYK